MQDDCATGHQCRERGDEPAYVHQRLEDLHHIGHVHKVALLRAFAHAKREPVDGALDGVRDKHPVRLMRAVNRKRPEHDHRTTTRRVHRQSLPCRLRFGNPVGRIGLH